MSKRRAGSVIINALRKKKKDEADSLIKRRSTMGGVSGAIKSNNSASEIKKNLNVSKLLKELIRKDLKRTPAQLKKGLGFKSGVAAGVLSTYAASKADLGGPAKKYAAFKVSAKAKAKDAADKILKKQREKKKEDKRKKHHS
tara:strand:+ start:1360 stop:1785 length:426 start_codon:yes stop_codon:yes gene_type:complete